MRRATTPGLSLESVLEGALERLLRSAAGGGVLRTSGTASRTRETEPSKQGERLHTGVGNKQGRAK